MIQFINRYAETIGGTAGIISIFGVAIFVAGCDSGTTSMIWSGSISFLVGLFLYVHTSMIVDEREEN